MIVMMDQSIPWSRSYRAMKREGNQYRWACLDGSVVELRILLLLHGRRE